MKKRYTPYGIDIKYECNTYRYVGLDYGNSKNASVGLIRNIRRFVRKIKNRRQSKYSFCNTYSEWEQHVCKVLDENISNYNDLVHWLVGEERRAEKLLEIVKAVLIPIYLMYAEAYTTFCKDASIVTFVIILFVIIFISGAVLARTLTEVNFYKDFLEVAERKETGSCGKPRNLKSWKCKKLHKWR